MQTISVLLRGSGHNFPAGQFRARVGPAALSASNQRSRQNFGPCAGAPSPHFTSLPHNSFLSHHLLGLKLYSSMASSGKIDLNSPTITWKEAKSYLKGLNNKQKRDHYSVKDFIKLKQIPVWKDTAKKANIKQPEEGKYAKNKALNEKVSLFRGDITKLEVDAIINTGK
ncbi:hypothetical protein XELAEV_18022219mg [Xenopus laevis]|uniref:Macro domain-containing protein n=1 Tax=Xenopus laevis TaxID=8355 RepID=A0A974D4C5_XENLA|nr:hypothetical protein XELAEV_18022219mg [Xenopus laevis]